jgi:hypothetical protein
MSGPFIFIATNRLKPGKREAERARVDRVPGRTSTNDPATGIADLPHVVVALRGIRCHQREVRSACAHTWSLPISPSIVHNTF